RLYEQVKGRFGLPNVLISNAGQGIHEKITEGDPEKWARIIDINLMGALRFVRAFVGEMMQQGKAAYSLSPPPRPTKPTVMEEFIQLPKQRLIWWPRH